MANRSGPTISEDLGTMPPDACAWPILYEDDEEGDLGEASPHVLTDEILHVCLSAHFRSRRGFQVFRNMNLYYQKALPKKVHPPPYVSPDNMVVRPFKKLEKKVQSYTIGVDGPVPVLTAEILSERSGQQRDLTDKVILYAKLRIPEYILVDVTGEYMAQQLLLKRLQPDRTWEDEQDADGGVTSKLGFRLIIDDDGELRVLNTATGRAYVRPNEAEETVRSLEKRNRELQAELARLRKTLDQKKNG